MALFSLQGKVAVVTGGNGGIGLGIARGLAAEGCHVVLNGRDAETLTKAQTSIEALGVAQVATCLGDVTEPGTASAFVETAIRAFGRIDVLVNNVGGSTPKLLVDDTDEDWVTAFSFNLFHAVRLARLCIPAMSPGPSRRRSSSRTGARREPGSLSGQQPALGIRGYSGASQHREGQDVLAGPGR